jgi:soluble lytic murein transglycosylase-like protein
MALGQQHRFRITVMLATWIVAIIIAQPATADIYTYLDESGVRHISNIPDDPRYRLLGRSDGRSALKTSLRTPADQSFRVRRDRLSRTIERVSRALDLDPGLIKAVIQAESAFDPDAVSHAGAVGLMQLMPATAARYGVKNRRDPVQNLVGGARYLRDLLDEFKNLKLALAAYNAGEEAVRRYGYQIPPYQETQTYVKRVERFYANYR